MCGRVTLRKPKEIAKAFAVDIVDSAFADNNLEQPQFNLAPSQLLPVITDTGETRRLTAMKWGLLPHWAKPEKFSTPLINARADTVDSKPSFRTAFKKHRCLIPIDGFYEWKAIGKQKQPMFIRQDSDELFALAGIYDLWINPETNSPVPGCAIVTTSASAFMQSIHDRMPVILSESEQKIWLSPVPIEKSVSDLIFKPKETLSLCATEVSTYVNSPRNIGEKCIEPQQT